MSTYSFEAMKLKVLFLLNSESSKYIAKLFFPQYILMHFPIHNKYDIVHIVLFPFRSHTFVEIDHEIISMAILLPSADSRRIVVSYERNYVHKVLVNCFNSQAYPGKKCG